MIRSVAFKKITLSTIFRDFFLFLSKILDVFLGEIEKFDKSALWDFFHLPYN